MPEDSFQLECDRLSQIVDNAQFEYLRWERDEGPKLTHLVALARASFDHRPEFELTEEGATRDIKRFVLKIHGKRVLVIALRMQDGQAVVESAPLERSSYGVAEGAAIRADFTSVDEAWMATALQQQLRRIRPPAAA